MTYSMSKDTHRVLVDPSFALEWRDISDFLSEFGPFNGRYVPRYPNNWPARLKEHVEDLSLESLQPVKRQAILERIRRELPLCSVPVGWQWIDEKSWAENVNESQQSKKNSIVVGDALDPKPFLAWVEAVEEIRQTRRRSWPFHGTVSEFVEACCPLLLNSPASYLVDRHLDPFSNVAENLIRSLFSIANGSKCYSIEIITRRAACGEVRRSKDSPLMTEAEIESDFKRIYRDIIPTDRSLKLHLVNEDKLGGDALRLHDRFFLTMHGSINFGHGFLLINQRKPQQNAFVTDKNHHLRFKQTFIDGVARYSEKLPKVTGIAYPLGVFSIKI